MHKKYLPDIQEAYELFVTPERSFRDLLHIRHNSSCLVNLCRTIPINEDEDLHYMTQRNVQIIFCVGMALVEKGFALSFQKPSLLAGKYASALYLQMWLRAKSLVYEYRPDLIPMLEQLA